MNGVVTKKDIDKEQQIKQMFDNISYRYDFLNKLLSLRRDVIWRKELVNLLPTKKDGVYLDVATGTGDVLFEVVKLQKYKKYFGIDISKGMLNVAAKKAKFFTQKINWSYMSAHKLCFLDNVIDAITISFGIRNVSNHILALSEFYRVLKPSGDLCIMEFFVPTKGVLAKIFLFYFKYILPYIAALFSKKDAYSYLPKSVCDFYSYLEFIEILKKIKFSIIAEKSYLFGCCRIIHLKKD